MSLFLHSIRTRLILCCLILVLFTGGGLMWFAHKDTISTLRSSARKTLDNVIYVLGRDLAASHADVLQSKQAAITRLKDSMQLSVHMSSTLLYGLSPQELSSRAYATRLKNIDKYQDSSAKQQNIKLTVFSQKQRQWQRILDKQILTLFLSEQASLLLKTDDEIFAVDPQNPSLLYLLKRTDYLLIIVQADLNRIAEEAKLLMEANSKRFYELIKEIHIQQTGFAAVLDKAGELVVGSENVKLSPIFKQTLQAETFSGAQRRVMLLPSEEDPQKEILYLISYFRPLEWNLIVAAPLAEMEATVLSIVSRQLVLTAVIMLISICIALIFANHITHPLQRLTKTVRNFPKLDISNLDHTALLKELPLKRKDEIGELAKSFDFMATELHSNISQLIEATAAKERLNSELEVARDIQYGILPQLPPPNPYVELYAQLVTAKEVGGDLYDFFFLNKDELCFTVGDVSDKSVPAALFMSMVVTTLRSLRQTENMDLAAVVTKLNNVLAAYNPKNMFVTLCTGIFNFKTGNLRWVAAGHMPPILLSKSGAHELKHSGDMMAGVFEDLEYALMEAHIEPEESIFLYTDGVSEAFNLQEHMYGRERLLVDLKALYGKNAEDISNGILKNVQDFAGKAAQSDDIAVMAIRRTLPS